MSIRSLKLKYNEEIRRFSMESLNVVEGRVSLEDLKNIVRKTFVELEDKEFTLSYKDEEEDVITVSTDGEIEEAFNVTHSLNSNVLRLEVIASKSGPPSKAVHFRVICDGCGMNPILGDRFKCSVREDFDLCSACEKLDKSPHAYLKIKTPAQAPAAIMTILQSHQEQPLSSVHNTFAEKVMQTEEKFNDDVVSVTSAKSSEPESPTKKEHEKKEQKPKVIAGITMPSLVRLECLSAIREFGPFYALCRPNGTLVLRDPNDTKGNSTEKPWKQGACLRLNNRNNTVAMDGNGGPWASFHVQPVADASGGGGSKVVRLVCANRKLCMAVTNGQLGCTSSNNKDINTHFILHEAGSVDEVDPVWDATNAAAACWEEPSPKSPVDNFVAWEGMSDSLMADVKAGMVGVDAPNPVSADEFTPNAEMSDSLMADVKAALASAPQTNNDKPSHPSPPVVPQASFLSDVTILDGQVMKPGETFVKTWRMRNDSDSPFPEGVTLVHASGVSMSTGTHISLNNIESEEEVRKVVSAKDKAWISMESDATALRNCIKTNDWTRIQELFDDLNKKVAKQENLIRKEGGEPVFYIRILVDLEDFLLATLKDKDAQKKMSKANTRALNRMKLTIRKHNAKFEARIKAYRENPVLSEEEKSSSSDRVPVKSTSNTVIYPHEEFDVAVPMVAPNNPGKYAAFWRLEVNGERFGHQVWVEIVVKESTEDLMKAAQMQAEKIQQEVDRVKAARAIKAQKEAEKKREEEAKAQAEAARVKAEEAARIEAEEAARIEAEEAARIEAEEAARVKAEEAARVEAEEAARVEAERFEAEILVRAETARIEAEALSARIEAEALAEAAERAKFVNAMDRAEAGSENGNSIDWECVDVNGNQNQDGDESESLNSEQLYASDLSASVEGAAMAGAALASGSDEFMGTQDLAESLQAAKHEPDAGPWSYAVSRLGEMGFSDVPVIVAACEKHATPQTFEDNIEVIVNELFN